MITVVLSMLLVSLCYGEKVISIPQLGPHTPLFYVEKNQNPQNEMVVFVRLDDSCRLLKNDENAPLFDFYWLMDHKKYKPTHSLIKNSLRKRLQVTRKGDFEFSARISKLKELEHDIANLQFEVTSKKKGQACSVETLFTLGPSDDNAIVNVKRVFVASESTFMPPFRKVKAITLIGNNVQTLAPVNRTYFAK